MPRPHVAVGWAFELRAALVLDRRYSKLSDQDLLQRLMHVCQEEGVAHTPDGLEAVVFTADGDMRQALNNLQVGRGHAGGRQGARVPVGRRRAARCLPAPKSACCPWCVVQATANGFGLVSQDHVFRVCDQPHPVLVSSVVRHCLDARIDDAYEGLKVWSMGSAAPPVGRGQPSWL